MLNRDNPRNQIVLVKIREDTFIFILFKLTHFRLLYLRKPHPLTLASICL